MFNAAYRRVIDSDLPVPVRHTAFLWCIEFYCWLTHQRFHATYLRLGLRYGFDWQCKPDAGQLEHAVRCLKDERDSFLQRLNDFAVARREAKAFGQRRPAKRHLEDLYRPDWIANQD